MNKILIKRCYENDSKLHVLKILFIYLSVFKHFLKVDFITLHKPKQQ
jgi:hypothetical protein